MFNVIIHMFGFNLPSCYLFSVSFFLLLPSFLLFLILCLSLPLLYLCFVIYAFIVSFLRKFTDYEIQHFKMFISVCSAIFIELCNHQHCLVLKHIIIQKETLCSLTVIFHSPLHAQSFNDFSRLAVLWVYPGNSRQYPGLFQGILEIKTVFIFKKCIFMLTLRFYLPFLLLIMYVQ